MLKKMITRNLGDRLQPYQMVGRKSHNSKTESDESEIKGIRSYEYTYTLPQTYQDTKIAMIHATMALGAGFSSTSCLTYLMFGDGFVSVLAGFAIGSVLAFVQFDRVSVSQKVTNECHNIDYSQSSQVETETEEESTQIEFDWFKHNGGQRFYVTQGLQSAIFDVAQSEGRISRKLLMDSVNLNKYYSAPFTDWTKVFPLVVRHLMDMGLIEQRGNSKVVTTDDERDWSRWVYLPH